jgi:hypothetical protein
VTSFPIDLSCAELLTVARLDPSAIVPVLIREEIFARMVATRLPALGLVANLVEYPAVAKGNAHFRFQVYGGGHGGVASAREAEIRRDSQRVLASFNRAAKYPFSALSSGTLIRLGRHIAS